MERTVKIDEEFKALIPPLTEDEFSQLEKSIIAEGCRDPLVVWGDTLVEGHNRYEICTKHGIEFKTVQREFESRDSVKAWMIDNQLGRRNLTTAQRIKLALLKEPLIVARAKEQQGSRTDICQNSDKSIDTKKEIAALAGTSHDTVARYKKIRESADEDTIKKVDSGELSINSAYTVVKRKFDAEVRQEKRANKPLPEDKFSLVLADPPWRYDYSLTNSRKIENQYPTMDLDGICNLSDESGKSVVDIFDDDCVLFMWTTSPKLLESFKVIDAWGFQYKTCLVWDKQKIGMGYYARQQHEILLVATRGNPGTPEPGDRPPSVISEPRGKHSAKPEVFRETIEKMYPHAKKVELFCRTPRDGWEAWGNEV